MTDHTDKVRASKLKTLRPRKHELDFFIADEIELSSFRDEMATMEHPFFALKAGDTKVREYKNGVTSVTIRPAAEIGLATVFDKDVWIYSISKLQESMNNNEPISRTICFTPYDFFVTTNRAKCGRAYNDLEKALDRLSGTRITTNIVYSDEKQESIGFGLIDEWRIIDEKKGKLDIGMVEVTLPNWLYQALHKKKMLKISPDYFRIRKAVDRRIYEIVRKHCGNQGEFTISLEKLHLKTGSTANKAEFKRMLKNLEKANDLPDYSIRYDAKTDMVIFNNRNLTPDQEEKEQQREKGKREIYKLKNSLAEKRAKN
ncbi:replication initiator protein A (plasmid) [Arsenophonus nasoniae]|uniref:Replication initiator protein A n=1 Tax=Arsenophonus nasoniae TaxID=638 RepID=D2TXU2_9GAMM|nr:replication initiator protein A [Arsenophonus nasoniae]QBY46552.1 Replication initiator protein A [Arsenophonus nasoniae]WGM08435.1 replication initiator protein A [Arsenophonus nasoniae]WGM13298.1 replication initiator protein A [Arsenophonus nasoniae]WGM17915.1 replication initiator protein A [Arsenophonus nasoniae]CBA72217.1 replication protein A RepA [Arsenophonus nasoniae]